MLKHSKKQKQMFYVSQIYMDRYEPMPKGPIKS